MTSGESDEDMRRAYVSGFADAIKRVRDEIEPRARAARSLCDAGYGRHAEVAGLLEGLTERIMGLKP